MAYVNLKNTTIDKYDQIIYSGDARYKIKITFNGKELANADTYLEKMVRSSRVLPDDSSKRFSLDNFVAQTIQLTLHDIDTSTIQEPINISLGTLVDSDKNTYEYVPLGVFNIQEKPTTDKGITTLKLIDNRVKFDTTYDGSTLIKANNGSVTKKQVLDDICKSVGVVNDITTFLGEDDKLGIYDNTIKATTYVSYMLEQAGCFAIITREGHLGKVELNKLTVHRIPSSIVEENYSKEKDKSFKVERVVYEDAIRKYDSNTDKNVDGSKLQTLYLNAANPYISSQKQIEDIYTKLKSFEINSVVTQKVMGNPRIDPWDIIEVYDYYSTAETKPVLFRTLANQEMTYTGVLLTTYKTEIGTEAQKENVTITGNAATKKWAKTEIDNINVDIKLQTGRIDETSSKVSELEIKSDEVSSRLQNISDLTVNNEGYVAKLSFTNINQGSPVEIRIHPTNTDISYLYPSKNLFPSDLTYLKIRDILFKNTKTNEIFRYTLPMDLWYLDENTYDEFILDYAKQECKIIQRVDWNKNQDKYKLDKEVVHTFDFPNIYLTDGDYEVSLPGYSSAYMYTKLMIQNEYTKQFATKVELNSSITQLDDSITLKVEGQYADAKKEIDKKADDEEVNKKFKTVDENITAQLALKVDKDDNDQVVSMINASANIIHLKSNRFIVESDNLNITETGKLTCTEGKIGNMIIGDNSFYLPITTDNPLNREETINSLLTYLGKYTPSDEEKEKFDVNKDGEITLQDTINSILGGSLYNITQEKAGRISFVSNKLDSAITLFGGDDVAYNTFGLDGVEINSFETDLQNANVNSFNAKYQGDNYTLSGEETTSKLEITNNSVRNISCFGKYDKSNDYESSPYLEYKLDNEKKTANLALSDGTRVAELNISKEDSNNTNQTYFRLKNDDLVTEISSGNLYVNKGNNTSSLNYYGLNVFNDGYLSSVSPNKIEVNDTTSNQVTTIGNNYIEVNDKQNNKQITITTDTIDINDNNTKRSIHLTTGNSTISVYEDDNNYTTISAGIISLVKDGQGKNIQGDD